MQGEAQPSQPQPGTEPVEARSVRLRRYSHRTGLYTWAFLLVALLIVVVALTVANTRQVKLSWVIGSGHASLVWIILAAAVLGWLSGILTGIVFRLRTRRRRSPESPRGRKESPASPQPGSDRDRSAPGPHSEGGRS